MADEAAPTDRAEGFDRTAIGVRLDQERRRASLLGDIGRRSSGRRTAW